MDIRPSTYEDAWEAAALLRRSIAELCAADHEGDPARLDPWLANKTPESFARWIDAPENAMVCAVVDGRLAGVAALRRPDEVMLVYVHPEMQRQGVARAMLTELERLARLEGARRMGLTSTRTAHGFYAAQGYLDEGPATSFGMAAFRMGKALAPEETAA